MKRNRRHTKRMSVVASHTMHVFGVMIVLLAMVIVNMLASSNCTQLQKTIGDKNRQLAKLENDRVRESARWNGMTTIDQLESALRRAGLKMGFPKPIQVVRMDGSGKPLVAQNSVREALRRAGAVETASYRTDAPAGVRSPVPSRIRNTRRARR